MRYGQISPLKERVRAEKSVAGGKKERKARGFIMSFATRS